MHPGWIPASFPGIWLNWHLGCLSVYAILYKGMYLVNGSAYRTMSARYILEDSLVLIRDSVRMTRYVQSALWPHHGQCSHIQRYNGIIWKNYLQYMEEYGNVNVNNLHIKSVVSQIPNTIYQRRNYQ